MRAIILGLPAVVTLAAGAAACTPRSGAFCGNGLCGAGENASTCPADCSPGAVCGNGACEAGESAAACPQDCPAGCGNGTCDAGENAATCAADCQPVCGNGACDPGESAATCAADCPICGDGVCSGAESAASCPADCAAAGMDAGFRMTVLAVQTPTTLGIVNGILASGIADGSIILLLEATGLGGAGPMLRAGDGAGTGTTYSFLPGESSFDASFDPATRRVTSTSPGAFVVEIGVDTDGDMVEDLVIPLDIRSAPGQPLFDFTPDAAYASFMDGAVRGAILVDSACAVNVDLGGGSFLNLLDILDGAGMGTSPPDTTPPCAPGTGPANIQPDVDVDGNGIADSYAVYFRMDGVAATITN